jgi:hypothetical protein
MIIQQLEDIKEKLAVQDARLAHAVAHVEHTASCRVAVSDLEALDACVTLHHQPSHPPVGIAC